MALAIPSKIKVHILEALKSKVSYIIRIITWINIILERNVLKKEAVTMVLAQAAMEFAAHVSF